MKIAVIGAGIIGVTSAWELAADGHDVTVFESLGTVAEAASFAPSGLASPGHLLPWEAPNLRSRLLTPLRARPSSLRLSRPWSGADLAWLWRSWRLGSLVTQADALGQLQRLASFSRHRLHQISSELQFDFERSQGLLVLLRQERDERQAQAGLQALQHARLVHQRLNPAQARLVEPGLNPDAALHAALHLPNDEVGNCRQFAGLLKSHALQHGVRFRFQTRVHHLDASQPGHWRLQHKGGSEPFEAVLLCAGAGSAALLQALGLKLPLRTVYTHALSAPLREPLNAPRSAVLDERYQITITRIGQRVRVSGCAQLGGRAGVIAPGVTSLLYRVLHDWFPGASPRSTGAQVWQGACATLPDALPVLGPSGIPGLWLNLGHGHNAWALSCGSARLLADQIAQRPIEWDTSALQLGRLRR